jgi:hypothetical protein
MVFVQSVPFDGGVLLTKQVNASGYCRRVQGDGWAWWDEKWMQGRHEKGESEAIKRFAQFAVGLAGEL